MSSRMYRHKALAEMIISPCFFMHGTVLAGMNMSHKKYTGLNIMAMNITYYNKFQDVIKYKNRIAVFGYS